MSGHFKPDPAVLEIALDLLSLYPHLLADTVHVCKISSNNTKSFEHLGKHDIIGRAKELDGETQAMLSNQVVCRKITVVSVPTPAAALASAAPPPPPPSALVRKRVFDETGGQQDNGDVFGNPFMFDFFPSGLPTGEPKKVDQKEYVQE